MSFNPLPQYSTITGHHLINVTTLILKEYVSATHVITSNYKHVCFKCSGNHPVFLFTPGMGQGNSVTQLLRPRTPNVQNFGFQHNFRHRVPGQNSTRFHGQGGPRYMGPR